MVVYVAHYELRGVSALCAKGLAHSVLGVSAFCAKGG